MAKPVTIESREYEMVAAAELVLHPRNPRKGNLAAVRQSIERNGFVGALVANRRTRHVLAGNHRLMAARDLGLSEVPVIWVDVPPSREVRILLADNRASDLGAYDDAALVALLQEAAQDGALADTLFTTVDLHNLIGPDNAEVDDPYAEWVGMPELAQEDEMGYRRILVRMEDDAAVASFAERLGVQITDKTKGIWWPPRANRDNASLAYESASDED